MATANPQRILEALEALAEELSITVCYEPMNGSTAGTGGLCRLRGEYRVIIDRRLGARERAQILSGALRRFDLTGLNLADDVRPFFPEPTALVG